MLDRLGQLPRGPGGILIHGHVVRRGLRKEFRRLRHHCAFRGAMMSQSSEFLAQTSPNDMAMYQYTSGTTRELPEAVKHRHRAVVTVMVAALYGTGIRPGDRYLCPSSPAWGHGLWHGTIAPL